MKWFLAALALLYALFPFDALPDFMAGLGWLDDLLLAGLVWYFFFKRPGTEWDQTRSGRSSDSANAHGQSQRKASDETTAGSGSSADPYRILEVAPGASQKEIRAAYRRLAARYHPDKVAHLGDEFQAMAERKFKAIQNAYDVLRQRG